MQFSDIPGHQELKEQLISSYKRGKVAHAQLFAGRQGGAVMPMALAYASYLMCEQRTSEDSCGVCPNCQRIRKGVHPDLHFIFPKVSASDSSKYDKVLADALPKFREFFQSSPFGDLEKWSLAYGQENKNLLIGREDSRYLLKNVSMRSVEGGYKIILIWCSEMMNASSANAILKVLEEPPEKTIYLLMTYSYDLLLSTITSRSQLIVVPPNTDEEIRKYLVNKGVPDDQAIEAAKLSEGSIGKSVSLTSTENIQEYKSFQKWMLDCWKKDLSSLVKNSEDFSKSGKAFQKQNLNYSISMVRNAVRYYGGGELSVLNEEEQAFISNFSNKLGYEKLEKVYALINEAALNLERNSNPRITHLNLSLDIIRVIDG